MSSVANDTIGTAVINTHYNTDVVQQLTPWNVTLNVNSMSSVANDTIGTAVINTHYNTEVVQQLTPWKVTLNVNSISSVANGTIGTAVINTHYQHRSSAAVNSTKGDVKRELYVISSE